LEQRIVYRNLREELLKSHPRRRRTMFDGAGPPRVSAIPTTRSLP
jgi:hypothetical protein